MDFKTYLREELISRRRKNPRYSIRAFAASLGIENSALAKLLSGRRALSLKMKERLADKLNIEPAKRAQLLGTSNGQSYIDIYNEVALEHFKVISDWHHFAILELTRIKNFQSDPEWIAKKLGLDVDEVKLALERLVRLNFLKVSEKGQLRLTGSNTTTHNKFTNLALKKLQKQLLLKARQALDKHPIESRDQSAITMAIDKNRLPEAKEQIRKFRRSLSLFLENEKNLDSVYQLTISLFPLTEGDE